MVICVSGVLLRCKSRMMLITSGVTISTLFPEVVNGVFVVFRRSGSGGGSGGCVVSVVAWIRCVLRWARLSSMSVK
jgi:hypothetical protein